MRNWFNLLATFLLSATVLAGGEKIGVCPPAPTNPLSVTEASHGRQVPPTPDAKPAGTVSLLALVRDTGEVCDVQLISGFDKSADAQAMRLVRQWRFQAILKNGAPVPQVVRMDVKFWRTASGQLVQNLRGPAK